MFSSIRWDIRFPDSKKSFTCFHVNDRTCSRRFILRNRVSVKSLVILNHRDRARARSNDTKHTFTSVRHTFGQDSSRAHHHALVT